MHLSRNIKYPAILQLKTDPENSVFEKATE